MPSGAITITPGKILAPGEPVNNAKLNQGFRPTGRLNAQSVSTREMDAATNLILASVRGRNLFCNGGFALWMNGFYTGTGVTGTGRKHDYFMGAGATAAGPSRWVTPNDANRTLTREAFDLGQTDVPDSLPYFLRWAQSSNISGLIDPAYIGQRLEDVRTLSLRTVTLAIWVRCDTAITLTPGWRQSFGTGGSADVTGDGTTVTLVPDTWTEIKRVFTLPSVAGKTLIDTYNSFGPTFPTFTEFRLKVPLNTTFQLDVAHASLFVGTAGVGWDDRLPQEDYIFATRYHQFLGMMLSADVAKWLPFVNLPFPIVGLNLAQVNIIFSFSTGTGATLAFSRNIIVQDHVHSAISASLIIIDSELHAAA